METYKLLRVTKTFAIYYKKVQIRTGFKYDINKKIYSDRFNKVSYKIDYLTVKL